jgi:hypothetical protein
MVDEPLAIDTVAVFAHGVCILDAVAGLDNAGPYMSTMTLADGQDRPEVIARARAQRAVASSGATTRGTA